jgi:phage anti-repressor protein
MGNSTTKKAHKQFKYSVKQSTKFIVIYNKYNTHLYGLTIRKIKINTTKTVTITITTIISTTITVAVIT